MTTHSNLSPSKRVRWANCPGSIREEANYPPKPSGTAAVDGTHTHSLLEKCINDFKGAAEYIGLTLKDHEGEFTVDAERAERVEFALNYIEKRMVDLNADVLISERKVSTVALTGRTDLDGTVDVTILSSASLEIIDYKDGMSPVDAKDNHQMEQYAFGVISEMQAKGLKIPETIVMTIIQPKLRTKGMRGIDSHTVTLAEMAIIGDKIKREAAATDAPDAPLVAGDKQCKYCAHAGSCTALSAKALGDAGIAFAAVDVTTQAADKEPANMTDQQLREIIESAPLLRQMIEGAEAEALRRLESGKTIEGIKAVRGRGSRAWAVDDDDQMAEKLKKMGLPKDVIWTSKLISVAQAEKATWTKKKGDEEVKMQLSDRQLKTLKSEYTKTTEGKISVASASDPRPAVTLSVAPMFTAVPSELPSFLL
jgi:glycerol-3-phosphate cytidylyltransferase-like family protein